VKLVGVSEAVRVSTVTRQVAVLPLAVSAVMVEVPSATAVIWPELLLTVATAVSLEVQVRVWSVVSAGAMVATRVKVEPMFKLTEVLSRLTEAARTGGASVMVEPVGR
jgi:hypothetical protein